MSFESFTGHMSELFIKINNVITRVMINNVTMPHHTHKHDRKKIIENTKSHLYCFEMDNYARDITCVKLTFCIAEKIFKFID